jgi:hypothetical protein
VNRKKAGEESKNHLELKLLQGNCATLPYSRFVRHDKMRTTPVCLFMTIPGLSLSNQITNPQHLQNSELTYRKHNYHLENWIINSHVEKSTLHLKICSAAL